MCKQNFTSMSLLVGTTEVFSISWVGHVLCMYYVGFKARKPVFGVTDQVRFKQVYSATKTKKNIEILHGLSLITVLPAKSEVTSCFVYKIIGDL